MKLNPRRGTGVSWDNFDRFVETITGKETVHDTVGITYQTIREEEPIDQEPGDDENLSSKEETCFIREVTGEIHETLDKKKRRQAYQSRSLDIIPYRENLKLRTSDFLSNDNLKRLKFENTSTSMNNWKIDILWMLNYVVNLHSLIPLCLAGILN